jgi:hypothetical protein
MTSVWAVSSSGLPGSVRVVMSLLLLLSASREAYRRFRPPVRRISWKDDALILHDRQGGMMSYRLRGRGFISPVFIGLTLVAESGAGRSLGLFRGQVDEAFWRRSMIRIRSRPAG